MAVKPWLCAVVVDCLAESESVRYSTALPRSPNLTDLAQNCEIPMQAQQKRSRTTSGEVDIPQIKLFRLQDHRENMGDLTTSAAIQTEKTVSNETVYHPSLADTIVKASFNTIGSSGTVMNVAGDLHMYNGENAAGTSMR